MDTEKKKRGKKVWEVDPGYIKYVKSHYPEAIEFLKKNINDLKYGNFWLDIDGYDTFSGKAPDGSRLLGAREVILFKRIRFDVFPRKIRPQYIKGDIEQNKYLTWKCATEDIEKQRRSGYQGERWNVICGLDVRKSAATTKKVLVPDCYRYVENPEYKEYLKSPAFQEYQKQLLEYEEKLKEYREFRCKFHDFRLPDGTIKQVLLYVRPDEKFQMLRQLGVSLEELNACAQKLTEPAKPFSHAPAKEIRQFFPEHYEDWPVPEKFVWRHYLKAVHSPAKKSSKKDG